MAEGLGALRIELRSIGQPRAAVPTWFVTRAGNSRFLDLPSLALRTALGMTGFKAPTAIGTGLRGWLYLVTGIPK
jgi:hypothetical protein